jgi:hypothetical protein
MNEIKMKERKEMKEGKETKFNDLTSDELAKATGGCVRRRYRKRRSNARCWPCAPPQAMPGEAGYQPGPVVSPVVAPVQMPPRGGKIGLAT